MHEKSAPEFIVMPVPATAAEMFVVVETQSMVSHFARAMVRTSTTEERLGEMAEYLKGCLGLNEADTRVELAKRGLSQTEIDNRIHNARRMLTLVGDETFVFERITSIGYANRDGQEVVRKTRQTGPMGQRVFVMRCRVCGHEYGVYGFNTDICHCPECQDGLPGVSLSADRSR